MRKAFSRPESQLQTSLQIKESNRTMFELFSDDAFGRETQAITVEANSPIEIINTQGNYSDAGLH